MKQQRIGNDKSNPPGVPESLMAFACWVSYHRSCWSLTNNLQIFRFIFFIPKLRDRRPATTFYDQRQPGMVYSTNKDFPQDK